MYLIGVSMDSIQTSGSKLLLCTSGIQIVFSKFHLPLEATSVPKRNVWFKLGQEMGNGGIAHQ